MSTSSVAMAMDRLTKLADDVAIEGAGGGTSREAEVCPGRRTIRVQVGTSVSNPFCSSEL